MSIFWIKVKKFFGASLTDAERLAIHSGPVLVATPRPPSSTAAGATPTSSPTPTSPVAPSPPLAPTKPVAPVSPPNLGGLPSAPVPPLSAFDRAVRYVLQNEDGVRWDHDDGEFTNNPKDPGGATMWGIIKTEYEEFLGRKLTTDQVKMMPRETALQIYRRNFWGVIHGDAYNDCAKAAAIFDTAVNKGLGGCMVVLTDCLHNHFTVRYGNDLIGAVNAMPVQDFLAAMDRATLNYIDRRIDEFPNMEWARKGWENRANRLPTLPTFLAGVV